MMEDLDAQNLQQQIDQLRSMIPMVPPREEESMFNGNGGGAEYISGDDSNVVFTPVSGTNKIKVDVYYV